MSNKEYKIVFDRSNKTGTIEPDLNIYFEYGWVVKEIIADSSSQSGVTYFNTVVPLERDKNED